MSDASNATPAPSGTPAPQADPHKTGEQSSPVVAPAPQEAKPPEPKPEADKAKMETLRLQSELKRQKDTINAKQKELEAATNRLKAIDDAKASGKPAVALKALGFDDAKIAEILVGGSEPEDKVAKLEQQLAEMTQQFSEYRKRVDTVQSEREAEATKAKDAELATQRKAFVDRYHAQEEKFPLLASTQSGALILAEINRHHEETGEVLDPDDAAARVEQHLAKSVPESIVGFLSKKPIRALIEAELAKAKAAETTTPPADEKAADPKATEPPPERKLETPKPQRWSVRTTTLNNTMQRSTPPTSNGKASKEDVWAEVRAKYPGR